MLAGAGRGVTQNGGKCKVCFLKFLTDWVYEVEERGTSIMTTLFVFLLKTTVF